MRARLALAGLVLAVVAPLLSATPAAATTDPIDPAALTALKAAFVASGQSFDDHGGTVRAWATLKLDGRTLTYRTVQETDATGATRMRTRGDVGLLGSGPRSQVYFNSRGKPVAAKVTSQVRRALARHGLSRPPRWYAPGLVADGVTGMYDPTGLAGEVGSIEEGLLALTAASDGDRTTYVATIEITATTSGQLTMVTTHGLLTSLSGLGSEVRFGYGHAPIPVPAANRRYRALIRAEQLLASQADGLAALIPTRKPRAKRIAWLRKIITTTADSGARVDGVRQTARPVRGGVEVTGTIRSWKHPLTWRYTVTKKGIAATPVRTA